LSKQDIKVVNSMVTPVLSLAGSQRQTRAEWHNVKIVLINGCIKKAYYRGAPPEKAGAPVTGLLTSSADFT
jgi:hypothetical protein